MKSSDEIIKQVKRYFQEAKVSGSYILYEKGLLKYESINDIDIFVLSHHKELVLSIESFLLDAGLRSDETIYNKYGSHSTSAIFVGADKPIELNLVSNITAVSAIGVLQAKLLRMNLSDMKQLSEVFSTMHELFSVDGNNKNPHELYGGEEKK